jgi:hypothetical protein
MWVKEAVFVDKVRQWWSPYSFQGSPNFILAQKLKALKFDLIKWNTHVFGNITSLKQARVKELHTFDRLETKRALDPEKKLSKSLISSDLEKITLQEEISLRQKSRVLWLEEGDKCTKFFHRLANSNRRSILLSRFLSTAQLLPIFQLSEITLFSFMTLYSLSITTGDPDWINFLLTL